MGLLRIGDNSSAQAFDSSGLAARNCRNRRRFWETEVIIKSDSYCLSNGISLGGSGMDLKYASMSFKSASGITLAENVGMPLAGGCRTMAMNAAAAIGFGASFGPTPPWPSVPWQE